MKNVVLVAASVFVAACATAPAPGPVENRLATGFPELPPDARAVAERLAGCQHWAGEEGYDADRRREIASAMDELHCDVIEADTAAIRAKYAHDARVIALMDEAASL